MEEDRKRIGSKQKGVHALDCIGFSIAQKEALPNLFHRRETVMKVFTIFVITAALALSPSSILSQHTERAPAGEGQGMTGGSMHGGGAMCPMMGMGGMGMMGGTAGMSGDPKMMGRMMEMRGEMMMKMGEVMIKHGKQMQKEAMK
jgi:hypothetical protein